MMSLSRSWKVLEALSVAAGVEQVQVKAVHLQRRCTIRSGSCNLSFSGSR